MVMGTKGRLQYHSAAPEDATSAAATTLDPTLIWGSCERGMFQGKLWLISQAIESFTSTM
jgi:hypothetical protein